MAVGGWVLDKSAASRADDPVIGAQLADLAGDLLIAETALYHDLGVVHVNGDFSRIAEVAPLTARRLGP